MKVVEFKKESGVKEVIDSISEDIEEFDEIIVLAIDKEGAPNIFTSRVSMFRLAYMKLFFESWVYSYVFPDE